MTTKRKSDFSMENYIKKIPYDMDGVPNTPAACHLFNVNDWAKKLSGEKAQLLHHIIV